jgi:hypothetical protein
MASFVSKTHILGRFPELGSNIEFLNWVGVYDGRIWHETDVDEEDNLVLVLQSTNRLNIFAALLHRDSSQISEGILKHEIVETRSVDLTSDNNNLTSAVKTIKENASIDNTEVQALRPVIDFSTKEKRIIWEIDIIKRKSVQTFRVDSPGKSVKFKQKKNWSKIKDIPIEKATDINHFENFGNDWLAENECHHLTAWKPLALNIIGGAVSPRQKASAIFNFVRQNMKYDATITHIEHFTWSDTLIANICNWRGICDEWSVIQITLLRCAGVPAVLKFLSWQFAGTPDAHACVEWLDNNVWRHMDALYNAFDNRSIYRQKGALNIKVMDASFPQDARFTGVIPNWGVVDPVGDQKFYPYGDFIISPAYPGDSRQGYSY